MPELAIGWKILLLSLSVPGLYCLMVLLGRQLKRRQGVRLGWFYHLFAFCLAVYAPALLISPNWRFLQHLGAAVIVLGATVVVALLDRYLWDLYLKQQHGVTVPKFITELARIVIFALAAFAVLEFGYGQTLRGLLLAPGIAAVVIGLAMQDLVGNIIAGLALQAGKSFSQGDWLIIENRHAEVIEINWRSTRLRTLDHISIEIPNREIMRQTIVNLNRPQRLHAMRLPVTLDYHTPPTRAKDVLLHAVANAKGIAPDPKPKVYLKGFGESGIEYEIKFWMEDHAVFLEVCDAIQSNVWYGLRRHGIPIPYPTRTLKLERPARDKQQELQTAARLILRQQALFRCLDDEQLDALLPRGRVAHFGRGETLIQQGDNGDSMFILVEGEATALAERNGMQRPVGTLSAGDCFGEMSLLTGERRNATVVAQTDCDVVEIGKPVLANSLKQNPKLLSQLSELLAKRQMATEDVFAEAAQTDTVHTRQAKYVAGFMDRVRSFFEL